MTSARDIADARLAKGEITPDEHATLVAQFASRAPTRPPPLPPHFASPQSYVHTGASPAGAFHPLPPQQRSRSKAGWWIGGGVAVLLVALIGIGVNETVGGLSVGNVAATDTRVTFRLANGRSQRGDVLMWIEQNGIRMCERVEQVGGDTTYNMRIDCPTLRPGRLNIYAIWAETDPDMARVAHRLPVT